MKIWLLYMYNQHLIWNNTCVVEEFDHGRTVITSKDYTKFISLGI